MAYYGGVGGGFGGSGYNAEKVAQIISWFIFIIGLVETFFVIKDGNSFLAANIPYLKFDITSPAYGFVIAITMAVTLAVALGLALRTLAIIGIMFWLAVSGIVSCSSKGVNFKKLDDTTLEAGKKQYGSVIDDVKNAVKPLAGNRNKDEKPNDVFANIERADAELATAIKNNTVEVVLKSRGYTFVRNLTNEQLAWCDTDEASTALIAGHKTTWINCTTGKKWKAPK